MIRLALSLLLGVLIFQTSQTVPSNYILFGFVLIGLFYVYFPKGFLVYVAIFGYLWSFLFASANLYPSLDPLLEGQDLSISGLVRVNVKSSKQFARFEFLLDRESISKLDQRVPEKLMLSWYYPGKSLQEGEVCELVVRLKRHWRFANPGSLDKEKQMFLQGIGARGYVRKGKCAYAASAGSKFSGHNLRNQLIRNFATEQSRLKNHSLMQALSFGVREQMSQSRWDVLRITGTTHLLAISGLHLSAISFVVFAGFSRMARLSALLCERIPAQSVGAIAAVIAVTMYAYLAGFSVPTQRALIMVSVALLAILMRRPVVNYSLLACALLLVLLWNPLTVLSSSFWMSFLAVLFIFVIVKSRPNTNWIVNLVRIQIFLAIALFPVSLWFFSQGSVIAPLVNIIAIPVISFLILPLLLISQLIFALGIGFSYELFELTDYLLSGLWWFLNWCAQLKIASITFQPTLAGVLIFELGLWLLMQSKGAPGRSLSILFLPALFLLRENPVDENQMQLTILDVGQGLAVVVETANHTLIYDAGPRFTSGYSTGSAVVLPFLRSRYIENVDILMVSHNDNDHAGGAHALLDSGVVDHLLVSNGRQRYAGSSVSYCRSGDEWTWDGVQFRVLHPPPGWRSVKNNRSCVLQILHPSGSILLTGDIERSVEDKLINHFGDKLHSDLMVVPHHGSNSSSSRRFLARVRPQTAVFSVGYRNRYGFPHAKIMQRYQGIGADLADTSQEGAITFTFDSRYGMHREVGFRPRTQRYWNSTWDQTIDPN